MQKVGDIYRQASRVLVWLGLEENNSTHALELLNSLGSKIYINWLSQTMRPSRLAQNEPHWADESVNLTFDEADEMALSDLFHRPWFERIWIRQENLLAKEADMMVGHHSISCTNFRNATFVINRKGTSGFGIQLNNRLSLVTPLSAG